MENGYRHPSDKVLESIAQVLDSTFADLGRYNPKLPIEGLKRLAASNPLYVTALRKVIEATTTVDRVAVIASGNLSQEIGGPEQMMPGPPDAEFDEDAVKWLKESDFDRLTSEGTFERLLSHGNGTSQFLNLVSMAAMQGDLACVVAEPGRSPRANNPCFIYEQRVQQ